MQKRHSSTFLIHGCTFLTLQEKPYNKDDDVIKATSFEVISTLRDVLKISSLWRDHVQTYTQVCSFSRFQVFCTSFFWSYWKVSLYLNSFVSAVQFIFYDVLLHAFISFSRLMDCNIDFFMTCYFMLLFRFLGLWTGILIIICNFLFFAAS